MSKLFLHLITILILLPQFVNAQIFNEFQLEIRDYEISGAGVSNVTIEPEFTLTDSYIEGNETVNIFEFGYIVNDIRHDKQIMIVEFNRDINEIYSINDLFRSLQRSLEDDGNRVLNTIQISRPLLKYWINEDLGESMIYVNGRVTYFRDKLYFIKSEIEGDVSRILASWWSDAFFRSTIVNVSNVN